MGRYRRNYNSEHPDRQYDMAFRRMKKIKGFYVHLMIYILANTVIIILNTNEAIGNNTVLWSWQTFSTAIFWGVGLVAHWFSVFARDMFFNQDWEEKKIKQFMEQDKKEKWE
jgi:2TM domain